MAHPFHNLIPSKPIVRRGSVIICKPHAVGQTALARQGFVVSHPSRPPRRMRGKDGAPAGSNGDLKNPYEDSRLERNQNYCTLLMSVRGRRFLYPSDEDLSLGAPASTPATKTCRRGPRAPPQRRRPVAGGPGLLVAST